MKRKAAKVEKTMKKNWDTYGQPQVPLQSVCQKFNGVKFGNIPQIYPNLFSDHWPVRKILQCGPSKYCGMHKTRL